MKTRMLAPFCRASADLLEAAPVGEPFLASKRCRRKPNILLLVHARTQKPRPAAAQYGEWIPPRNFPGIHEYYIS